MLDPSSTLLRSQFYSLLTDRTIAGEGCQLIPDEWTIPLSYWSAITREIVFCSWSAFYDWSWKLCFVLFWAVSWSDRTLIGLRYHCWIIKVGRGARSDITSFDEINTLSGRAEVRRSTEKTKWKKMRLLYVVFAAFVFIIILLLAVSECCYWFSVSNDAAHAAPVSPD